MTPTRSPGSTPLARRRAATRALPSSSIAYVTVASSSLRAVASPSRSALSVRRLARFIVVWLPRVGGYACSQRTRHEEGVMPDPGDPDEKSDTMQKLEE